MRRSNFEVVEITDKQIVLRDLGPWDEFMTITNNAENVVNLLRDKIGNRRLFYYDSEGELTEILVGQVPQ